MLKIFISSTFRDLKTTRKALISKIEEVLNGIGMENFIPNGSSSHSISINNLRESDIVIFLISSFYGSVIKECNIKDCQANCPMKQGKQKISYTECEYYLTLVEIKTHMIFIFDHNWNLISELDLIKGKTLDKKNILKFAKKYNLENNEILHYFKIRKKVIKFKNVIYKTEFYKNLKFPENEQDIEEILSIILSNLAENIINWYCSKKINFIDFIGRRNELKFINDRFKESIEVYGIGGMGKSTLIQIFLLILRLKGYNIISIGTSQFYSTSSGYPFYRVKCKNFHHEVLIKKIDIDDILDSFLIDSNDSIRKANISNKTDYILKKILKNKIILFIDDFQYADDSIKELVKKQKNMIISSRKKENLTRNSLKLNPIDKSELNDLIDLITKRFNINLTSQQKKGIITNFEGHPILIEFIIRNIQRINLFNKDIIKYSINRFELDNIDELSKRVISEILTESTYKILQVLSLFNTKIRTDIDLDILTRIYTNLDVNSLLTELIKANLIKKKRENSYFYEFTYHNIRELIENEANKKSLHEIAYKYYSEKIIKYNDNINDSIEKLFHASEIFPSERIFKKIKAIFQRISPSLGCCQRFLYVIKNLGCEIHPKYNADIKNMEAVLNFHLKKYKLAEISYLEAYEEITRKIENKEEIFVHPSKILLNLSSLYLEVGNYINAKKFIDKSRSILKINKGLLSQNEFFSGKALINNALGVLNLKTKDFIKAEKYFLKSISIFESVSYNQNEEYLNNYAKVLNNLSILYRLNQKFSKSIDAIKRSLDFRDYLSKINKDKYLLELVFNYNSYANLLWHSRIDLQLSLNYYEKALSILDDLVKKDPDLFDIYYAQTLNGLGVVHRDLKNFKKSEEILLKALDTINKIEKLNPYLYLEELARIQLNLGNLYLNNKMHIQSEEFLTQALKNYKIMFAKNPEIYKARLGNVYINLTALYSKMNDLIKAKQECFEAKIFFDELIKKDKTLYKDNLLIVYHTLGVIYFSLEDCKNARYFIKKELKFCKSFFHKKNKFYQSRINDAKQFLIQINEKRKKSLDMEKNQIYKNS